MNRTCFRREWNRSAFDAPAEPVEKLLFCSFDHHWITTNAEDVAHRVVSLQFFSKPVCPLRDSGNSVDLGNGSPDKVPIRAGQQGSSRAGRHVPRGELLRHRNEVTQRFLASWNLDGSFETLRISFQTPADWLYI